LDWNKLTVSSVYNHKLRELFQGSGICRLENFGFGVEGKPREPKALDSRDFLPRRVGDTYTAVFVVPAEVERVLAT
jgi:hypothetical protein